MSSQGTRSCRKAPPRSSEQPRNQINRSFPPPWSSHFQLKQLKQNSPRRAHPGWAPPGWDWWAPPGWDPPAWAGWAPPGWGSSRAPRSLRMDHALQPCWSSLSVLPRKPWMRKKPSYKAEPISTLMCLLYMCVYYICINISIWNI